MAGPPNEYRTLRTINTFVISGAGFSIAVKTRKKTIKKKEDKREEIAGNFVDMFNKNHSPQQRFQPNWVNFVKGQLGSWQTDLCCLKGFENYVIVVERLLTFLISIL